ncbi:MAG: Bug family tripartite tricarboxylate transporter substrate binding protein [Pseudorhodoplanes sp.]
MANSNLPRSIVSLRRRRTHLAGLALTWYALVEPSAYAQPAYPARPIRIIVPFGPATGLDAAARGLAAQLAQQLGVGVVVENREGAGGAIGSALVQSQPADGYTLLYAANPPFLTQPMLLRAAGYDALRGFTPIAKIASTPMALVASNTAPYGDFQQFVEYARKNPGRINFAYAGAGTLSYLDMQRINLLTGITSTAVSYKSATQAMIETIGGQVDLMMPSYPTALPFIRNGSVKLLAVGSPKRSELFPDVPTFEEALKQPGFHSLVWHGLLGPAGMRPEVSKRLQDEVQKALGVKQIVELLEKGGASASYLGAEEFQRVLAGEEGQARKLLNQLGMKPE